MAEVAQRDDQATRRRAILIQLFLGLVANFSTLASGLSLGFSAVALPQMKTPDSVPRITEDEESWIASLAAIATPFGCLLSGPLLDRFGRRAGILYLNVPFLIGWILLGSAPYSADGFLTQVYAGRILTGIGTGMASVPATVYMAEIAQDSLRGILVAWTSIFISAGILIVYCLGSYEQEAWRQVAYICAGFPVMSALLAVFLLPESPVWLLANNRVEDATKSLRYVRAIRSYHKTPPYVQDELDNIAANISQQYARRKHTSWMTNFRKSFFREQTIRPLIILNAFFLFQQFSGIFVVVFYAVEIVEEAGVTINGYLVTILIGVARVVMAIGVSFASNRIGRRIPSIISGVGMTFCMFALALYLYLLRPNVNLISTNSWLPVTSLIIYIATSTIGFLTLPWAMIGELFPSDVRGLASGLTTCMAYVFSFVTVKLYLTMLDAFQRDGLFLFYAIVSCLGTIFVVSFLPETKGKTLLEIQEYFTSKKKEAINTSIDETTDKKQDQECILPISEKSIMIVPANPARIAINSDLS